MGILSSLFGGGKKAPEAENKKNFDILKYDGIRAQRIGKLPYAIKCFEEAAALNEEAEVLSLLAGAYTQAGRLDEARTILDRLIIKLPSDITPLLSLASLCYMQEDYTSMNEACQKALVINSKHPLALYLAAKAAVGLKNDISAIALLTQAIMAKDDYAEAYQLRAEVLWQMKQVKDAAEDVQKLLEMNPEDESALLLKGEILATTGKPEEAHELFAQVTALNPFNEKAYLLAADLYVAAQEPDRAIAVYDEALEVNPNFAQAYHERGRIKLQKGDKEGATEDMKRAMELAPENGENISGQYNNYEHLNKNVPF